MGENEVLFYEGMLVYGLLISKRTSGLLSSVLKITVDEFEAEFGFQLDGYVEPWKHKGFDEKVEKYFEFVTPEV